jgi:hypothetical protein
MDIAKARSEVQRMLLTYKALASIEEVLDVAAKAEVENRNAERTLAKRREEFEALEVAHKIATAQYADQQKAIVDGLSALRAQYAQQEAAQKEKLNALKEQVAVVEKNRDAVKAEIERSLARSMSESANRKAELEREHAARKAALQLEEDAVRARLDSAKVELNTLLKRITG